VAAQPQDEARYRGTVAKGEDTVTCIGTCANGHITDDAAQVCARKLEREHGDGWAIVPSVRVDRYRGIVTPKASGAKPTVCECKFSHKTQDAAIECAGRLAKAHGLTV